MSETHPATRRRGGIPWKSLRESLEAWGVRDEDVLHGIRFGPHARELGIRRNEDGGVEVAEQQGIWDPMWARLRRLDEAES